MLSAREWRHTLLHKLFNTKGCLSFLFCLVGLSNESQSRDLCLESIQSATPALSLPYYNTVRVIGNEFPASVFTSSLKMHRIKREWWVAVSIKLNQVRKRREEIGKLTLDSLHIFWMLGALAFLSMVDVDGLSCQYELLLQNVGGNHQWVIRLFSDPIRAGFF